MSKARVVFWLWKGGKGIALWKFALAEAVVMGAVSAFSYCKGKKKRKKIV